MIFKDNTFYLFSDPMCPWCYAMEKEVTSLLPKFPAYTLEIILGGLRRNDTTIITPEKGHEIEKSWKRIYEMSMAEFGTNIFEQLIPNQFTYNTEEACRAVVTFRELNPQQTHSFLTEVSKLFFIEGKDLRDLDNYSPLLKKFHIDIIAFASRYYSDDIRKLTYDDYALSKQVGVKHLPTLTFMKNGELIALGTGFRFAEDLESVMRKILKN